MTITRRGFLGLVGGLAVSAAAASVASVAKVLPRPVRRLVPTFANDVHLAYYSIPFEPELGFQEICPPGQTVSLVARVQRLLMPRRLLFLGDLNAFELLPFVNDQGESDLVGSVPLNFFAPEAYGTSLYFSPIEPNQEIVLTMRNVSDRDAEVRQAALLGVCKVDT